MEQKTDKQLIKTLLKRLEKIDYFCTTENVSPNLAVHEIRKAFKRMRAFLKFYSYSENDLFKQCKKTIVSHGKSISLLRESYVNILLYENITAKNNLISERKTKGIKETLNEQNRSLIKSDFYDAECTKAILESMKEVQTNLNIFTNEFPEKSQLIKSLCKSYSKAHSYYYGLNNKFDSEALHDLRKKIKQLYYQMDFLKFVNPKYFKMKSVQLHKLTEQLGQDHDLFVFLNDLELDKYNLDELELQALSKQIEYIRVLNLQKLDIRLKQLFGDSTSNFTKKMEEVFKEYEADSLQLFPK